LADCESFSAIRGMSPPAETTARAIEAARRAVELDPQLAEANGSLGFILSHSGDVQEGLRYLKKAVELNPGHADVWNILGRSLYALERIPEALEAIEKSVNLDPLSMMIYTGAGDAYYFARQYE